VALNQKDCCENDYYKSGGGGYEGTGDWLRRQPESGLLLATRWDGRLKHLKP